MATGELLLIAAVFVVPLLAAAIVGLWSQRRSRQNPVAAGVTVVNVVVVAVAPLVCSLLLVQRDLLPLLVGAVTFAGFVPAATSFCFWYALSHEDYANPIRLNALSFTLLNLVFPLVLTLLQERDLAWSLVTVCSFDFLALSLAATIVLLLGPVRTALSTPLEWRMIAGALAFVVVVFLLPALTFEYRWIQPVLTVNEGLLTRGAAVDLALRYPAIGVYTAYLVRHLRRATN